MDNFLVVWWTLVTIPLSCPDSTMHEGQPFDNPDGRLYSCAVNHNTIARKVGTHNFSNEFEAREFMARSIRLGFDKRHIQLIDMRD